MFSFLKKKPSVLSFKNCRVFGKLPGFADFVRYRSADPEAVKRDLWVSSGIEALMQQGMQNTLEGTWTMSLVEQGDKAFHLSSIISSQDKSGRHYPLVIMAEVENPWLYDYKPSLPLLFKILEDLGRALQAREIAKQSELIETINEFEKKSWVLSKTEVLDQRIEALKNVRTDQAWGHWALQQEGMDIPAWKVAQICKLRKDKHCEVPMGSEFMAQEASYWLQLLEDLREIKSQPLHYYCLSSLTTKKMLIQIGVGKLPLFQALFKPCVPLSIPSTQRSIHAYDGQLSLLAGAHFWKRVST